MSHLSIGHSSLWWYINSLWLRDPEAKWELGCVVSDLTQELWEQHNCMALEGPQLYPGLRQSIKSHQGRWDGRETHFKLQRSFEVLKSAALKVGHRSVCVQARLRKCQLSLVHLCQMWPVLVSVLCPGVTSLLWGRTESTSLLLS